MKIRNIIFDCNGTMIFDGKYHDIAWRTYVSKLAGRELTKEEFQHQIPGYFRVAAWEGCFVRGEDHAVDRRERGSIQKHVSGRSGRLQAGEGVTRISG